MREPQKPAEGRARANAFPVVGAEITFQIICCRMTAAAGRFLTFVLCFGTMAELLQRRARNTTAPADHSDSQDFFSKSVHYPSRGRLPSGPHWGFED